MVMANGLMSLADLPCVPLCTVQRLQRQWSFVPNRYGISALSFLGLETTEPDMDVLIRCSFP